MVSGFTGSLTESTKCFTGQDVHNRASFGPKSVCKFKCGNYKQSNQKISCLCEGKRFEIY